MTTNKGVTEQMKIDFFDELRAWWPYFQDLEMCIYGLDAWFEAYLQTPDFAKLDAVLKREAFSLYKRIEVAIRVINDHPAILALNDESNS